MKLLYIINTPAQAYTWHHSIEEFLAKGHDVKILARDYGSTVDLIRSFDFQYSTFKVIRSRLFRAFLAINHIWQCYKLSKNSTPSMVIGFGIDAAVVAALFRKPCVVFIDDEPTPIQNYLTKLLNSIIITPECFKYNLGNKHIRIAGYKELAYLHPDYFKPDNSIYNELKISKSEKYIILRFNAFDAIHDIGKHGFTTADRFSLIQELGRYVRVFISPEGSLPKELEGYRLPIPYERIHHALYYAQLLVTDTQTMATEAALLGTPVVRYNSFVGPNDACNFIELEQKYNLIYSFQNAEQAIQKSFELIKQPDLKTQWANKLQKLIEDKINVTHFLTDFIINYPESFFKHKDRDGIRG